MPSWHWPPVIWPLAESLWCCRPPFSSCFRSSTLPLAIGADTKIFPIGVDPAWFDPLTCRYLDSVGLIASLANRMVLRASLPTREQIRVWNRLIIPLSRILDKIVYYWFGRSIVAVWNKA